MLRRLFCSVVPLLGLLLLTACGGGEAVAPTPLPEPTPAPTVQPLRIVAMGDSLTEGLGVDPRMAYPAQLERRLQADGYAVEVINAGNSGETSSGALSRIDWVLSLSPDVVILGIGGNDGLRGIDVGVTEQNIARMVERFQAENVLVILAGMEMVQNMGQFYTDAFRAIYPTISAQYGVPLIPFLLEGVATDPALNQPDFIHPNADGYAVVVETVYPFVVEVLRN